MSGAYINLETNAKGELNVGCVYQGGYDPENDSHQVARILIEHLDTLMERRGEPVILALPEEEGPDPQAELRAAMNVAMRPEPALGA